ncbi:MAG: DUF1573 domain-containing protein [Prevotella sp.]|nr:DUF1573 domain-containing protein [Prevotella sp.]
MKHLIQRLSLFLLLILSLSACAKKPAKLVFVQKEVKMGVITKNPMKHELTVELKNKGGEIARIKDVRTSCTCVKGYPEKMLVKPGEKIKVKITVDTKDFLMGEFSKELGIYSNAKVSPVMLKISGTMTRI